MLDLPLPVVFVVGVLLLSGAAEIGLRAGRRRALEASSNASTIQSAVLVLLALLIGFTFSVAIDRFEARRDAILNEANAIGTAALRARLLPPPHAAETVKLLSDYVQLRLVKQETSTERTVAEVAAKSGEIHERLWQHVKAIAKNDNNLVPTGLFIQAVNDMIDSHEKRLTAGTATVPFIVILVLYGTALVASALTGYTAGFETKPARIPVLILILLLCSVLLVIQDLDRPGSGFIKADQQPLIDTAASIAAFKD